MKITLHHMSAEGAWKLILREYSGYHDHLKHYGYTYKPFVPDDKKMNEMFEQETLSQEQIKYYRDIFINEVYDVADLSKQDENIEKALPHFQELIEKRIKPLLHAWGAKLPESLAIQCNYGYGAGYIEGNNAVINLRVSQSKNNDYGIYLTLAHELVHILIEQPIIQKYKVPQDLKEGIVEIIGFELFDKNHHKQRFANSFIESYITPESIKTDLPGAVKKMMADYVALKQKQEQTEFLEQYEPLKKARAEIQSQIDELVAKDAKANLAQINELVDKRDAYRAAIIKLINEGSDKAFEEYAKKLFDMSLYVIGKNLSGSAIKFDRLSAEEKLSFAQEFINHIASRFHVTPNKLVYKTDFPTGMGAEYDEKTDNININKNDMNNLQYVTGMLLHEFTHYLYHKYPDKSPIGKEKALAAVAESYNGYRNLDEYKQKPFEAVAYYVQDYFEKHKFYEQLLSLITPTPDHER